MDFEVNSDTSTTDRLSHDFLMTFAQKAFIESALEQRLRIDGRKPFDIRKVRVSLGPTLGQSECQIGNTRVLAQVSCEIVRPTAGQPKDGIVLFHTDLSAMSGAKIETGLRTSVDEIRLSRMLEKALKRSKAIDTEGLCIIAGEQVWCIRIDIRVLDNDGNVLDCACIAAISAMMHFKRPDVTVTGDEHTFEEKHPVSLSIHHIPICTTFAFFQNGELMVVDPTRDEELAQDGSMTIVTNIHREVCCLNKAGGCPLEMDLILRCSEIALIKSSEITVLVREVVLAYTQKNSTIKQL